MGPAARNKIFSKCGSLSSPDLEGVINTHYSLDINNRLEEFDLDGAVAYSLNLNKESSSNRYYALVAENLAYVRLDTALELLKAPIPGLTVPIAIASVLFKDKTRKITMVFEKPQGVSVKNQIRQFIDETKIIHTIYEPLKMILKQLHEMNIHHGYLNLQNVFFDHKTDSTTLGQCVIGAFNCDQQEFFETAVRAEATYKSFNEPGADNYALAMLLFSLYYDHGDILKHEITKNRLAHGTTAYLLKLSPLTGKIGNSIRSLINKYQCNSEIIFSKPVNLFDIPFHNTASLAFALFENWDESKILLSSGKLLSFLKKHNFLSTIADIKFTGSSKFDAKDFKLAAIIMKLDNSSLIRIRGVSFYPSAFQQALENDSVNDLIHSNFFHYISHLIKNINERSICELITKNQKFLKSGFGQGISRFIYETSKTPFAISKQKNVNGLCNLKAILCALEENMRDLKSLTDDRDLINFFIYQSHLPPWKIMNENMDKLNDGHFMEIISCISHIQDLLKIKCPNLSKIIGDEICKRLHGIIKHNKLRTITNQAIENIATKGYLRYYFKLLDRYKYFKGDSLKHKAAIRDLQELEIKLSNLQAQKSSLSAVSIQKAIIIFSYSMIFFSMLYLIIA